MGQLKVNAGGATVFEGILHAFLGDAVKMTGRGLVMDQDGCFARERAFKPAFGGHALGEILQRLNQSIRLRRDGVEFVGKVARLRDGGGEFLGKLAGGFGLRRVR